MFMTHKERIFKAAWGEMPDILPYAPRIDLWHNANILGDSIPEKHRGKSADEIARSEGWAIHRIIPEYQKPEKPEDVLHKNIGLWSLKESVISYEMSPNIEFRVIKHQDETWISYITPLGTVDTCTIYTQEMKKAGISQAWIKKHIINEPKDYSIVRYIFENITLKPSYERFELLNGQIGSDGILAALGGRAASPIHHIQKYFLDDTAFFLHYKEHESEMRKLEEVLAEFFNRTLEIISASPAEAVLWGMSYDENITYRPYFEKDIMPWLHKASAILNEKGKILLSHCDSENADIMDLIRDSGINVAEAVCPFPMTKIKIEDYYRQWSDNITILGGIPSIMLLEESVSDEDFEDYLDHIFKAISPGKRFIVGIADSTPPGAVFERLVKIGDRVRKEGKLPLEGGGYRPLSIDTPRTEKGHETEAARSEGSQEATAKYDKYEVVREVVFKGLYQSVSTIVQEMLDGGTDAEDILQNGLIAAMTEIGKEFRENRVFIPEVLLSAKTMNEALRLLEPYFLENGKNIRGKVLLCTVKGDVHNIGKNLVAIMLKGSGFEVKDLGINVDLARISKEIKEYKPHILGLSALLTTTMQEMKNVIEGLKSEGLRDTVRIIVGGAPVNQRFADRIGADGYADNAGGAVELAEFLLTRQSWNKGDKKANG